MTAASMPAHLAPRSAPPAPTVDWQARAEALEAQLQWTDALMRNHRLNQGQRVAAYVAMRQLQVDVRTPVPELPRADAFTAIDLDTFAKNGVKRASTPLKVLEQAGALRKRTITHRNVANRVTHCTVSYAPGCQFGDPESWAPPDAPTRGGNHEPCPDCGSTERETVVRCKGCKRTISARPEPDRQNGTPVPAAQPAAEIPPLNTLKAAEDCDPETGEVAGDEPTFAAECHLGAPATELPTMGESDTLVLSTLHTKSYAELLDTADQLHARGWEPLCERTPGIWGGRLWLRFTRAYPIAELLVALHRDCPTALLRVRINGPVIAPGLDESISTLPDGLPELSADAAAAYRAQAITPSTVVYPPERAKPPSLTRPEAWTSRAIAEEFNRRYPLTSLLDFNSRGYARHPKRDDHGARKLQYQPATNSVYDHKLSQRYNAVEWVALVEQREPRDVFRDFARQLRDERKQAA